MANHVHRPLVPNVLKQHIVGVKRANIHAFVTDWVKIHDNISDLVYTLKPYCEKITVLSAPDAYFSEQFNTMLSSFSGDLMLWVMGDVTMPPKFWDMHIDILSIFNRDDIGVYSPNVEYTFHTWDTQFFNEIETGVYEVPCAEPNMWVIRKDVLNAINPIDISKNKFGWGVDLMVSAVADSMGLKTVRDYRYKAGHPIFTGYDDREAGAQMEDWKKSLSGGIQARMGERWDWGLKYNTNWRKRSSPVIFGSSTTGSMDLFASGFSRKSKSISITIDDGFNFQDTSDFKVYMQIEPPEVLDCTDKLIENHSFYDLILAWNEKVLDMCPNATLFPQALCTWIDKCYSSSTWNP